jgi:predicted transcriptional regulator
VLKEWLRTILPGKSLDEIERKLKPCLRDERSCALLRLILENPGITIAGLARKSHLESVIIEGLVNGFIASGLVISEKEGKGTGYHIAGAAKAAVVRHLPLNYQCPGMMRDDSHW